jgi:hypothetical protein
MTTTARALRKSHVAHIALVKGVIRQFDDMCLAAADSRRRIQGNMRAARAREALATDSPAVTRTRNHRALVHPPT